MQHLALDFNFVIQYKKGINMPARFLSRSGVDVPINSIQLTAHDLACQQEEDPEIQAPIAFRTSGHWPSSLLQARARAMAQLEPQVITDVHQRFWVRTTHRRVVRNLLFAPARLWEELMHKAHRSLLAGHSTVECKLDRVKTSWWWPSMEQDVMWHIKKCPGCQPTKKSSTKPAPLAPLPIP